MPQCMKRLLVAGSLCVSAAFCGEHPQSATADEPGAEQSQDAGQATATTLQQQVRAAESAFVPITEADVQRARNELEKPLARLSTYLDGGDANGRAWKRFLLWEALQAELGRGLAGDVPALEKVLARYTSGHVGLELAWFSDVTKALRRYIDVVVAAADPNARQQYPAQLESLAAIIEGIDGEPDAQQCRGMAAALEWLERHGQAPQVVAAVNKQYSRPNLLVEVSDKFITAVMSQPVDETRPVRDVIMGTRISGTGRTVGDMTIELVENPDFAEVETVLIGTTFAKTIGRNGPAQIWADSKTNIHGRKRLLMGAEGLWSKPARASARVRTNVTGIGSNLPGLCGWLVRRVAARRVPQEKAQGERIAAQHAQRMFSEQYDIETADRLTQVNRRFLDRFRYPLLRRGEFPRLLHFSTTAHQLRLTALQGTARRLGASVAPPQIVQQPQLVLRMHESLLNNAAEGLISGTTLDQKELQEFAENLLGYVPERLKEDEGQDPWTITFAKTDPITLRIDKNIMSLTVRGEGFTSGSKRYEAMNVTVRYLLEATGRGINGKRQGEFEIFPPDYVPGSSVKLSLRQTVLRNLLIRRFGKIFGAEFVGKGLDLPEPWDNAGTLYATQLVADRGWLLVGWDNDQVARGEVRPASSQQIP